MFNVHCRQLCRSDLLPQLQFLHLMPDVLAEMYSKFLSILHTWPTLRHAKLCVCPEGRALSPPSDEVLAGLAVHSAAGMCIMLSTQMTHWINFADEQDAEGVMIPIIGPFEAESPIRLQYSRSWASFVIVFVIVGFNHNSRRDFIISELFLWKHHLVLQHYCLWV
jgi:hypothetical protein